MINIVFINSTHNYPLNFSAGNTKMEFIARGLMESEGSYSITTLNSLLGNKKYSEVHRGKKDSIHYVFFPQKKIQLTSYLKNIRTYIEILSTNKKKAQSNFLVNDFTLYPFFLIEVLIARFYGYKIVSICHEWHISFPHRGIKKLSNYMFDKSFGYFSHAILPISTFLENKVKHFKKPVLKLPILADFDIENHVSHIPTSNYLIFCGHSRYLRTIEIILQTHQIFTNKGYKQRLKLILSGKQEDINIVKSRVEELNLNSNVDILSNIPIKELNLLYQNSLALLIPLSTKNEQDQARFSQKIAEYLCSRRPIITVNTGEIPYYFTNKINAFIANDFTATDLCAEFETIVSNPKLANEVGINGYQMGKRFFDYRSNGRNLDSFLKNI